MENLLIAKLPYGKDFLFVDQIHEVSQLHIKGSYFFSKELGFYASHFEKKAVTPGVILTECAAQIGLACFGMYLTQGKGSQPVSQLMLMSESSMDFFSPVYPDERVYVYAKLVYFRFGKLKVNVELQTTTQKKIAKGTLAGMIAKTNTDEAK